MCWSHACRASTMTGSAIASCSILHFAGLDFIPARPRGMPQECACEEGFGGLDCSKATQALEYGKGVNQSAVPFELLYFSLPKPTGQIKQAPAGECSEGLFCAQKLHPRSAGSASPT